MKVGLIGLGVMGYRIGVNLAKAGILNAVYNRTPSKAMEFSRKYGVNAYNTPEELVNNVDLVITMLSDDDAVSSVANRIIGSIRGKVLVDMSTISPSLSISLANYVRKSGGVMLDAPVVGTSIFVEQKRAIALVGGPLEVYNEVKPVLDEAVGRSVYMGGNGMGLYAKLVNNLLLGVYVAALAEAYYLGVRSGLSEENIAKVLIELSSARSPTSELKVPKIAKKDYSVQFALKHMRKDLEIIQKEAQRLSAPVPLSALSLQLYRLVEEMGYSDLDFSAVAELFRPKK